jgi:S-formylglutathione hydrolase FrmB
VALALATAANAAVAPSSPGCVARGTPPQAGPLSVVSTKALDARVTDYTLYSSAMQEDVHVNVMLPTGYDPSGATRYPVLYLLHGALGAYMNWYTDGDVEQLIGDLPLIVVMPDGGYDGSYSDWYGLLQGQGGPVPAWETFHVHELIPWVDASFPTRADRGDRFIAGLSAGGGGSTHYAADNPGLFGAVGSFSGANNNLEQYPFYPTLSEGLWLATDAPGDGPDGHCTWGDPYTQRVVWEDNDPTFLASNLRGTPLWLAAGNGEPGPLDPSLVPDPNNVGGSLSSDGGVAAAAATEMEIWQMTKSFVKALNAAGIPHTDYFYGAGTHSWPYWQRDLKDFLVWLQPYIGHPLPAPRTFSYRTADASFSAWGWRFTITDRAVTEFVYLSGVGRRGLTALGSGTLNVTTPPRYRPDAVYAVDAGGVQQLITASADRRLSFSVDIGASHKVQQYRFGRAATLGWQRTVVSINPA